jgi:hypothetical protein
MTRLKLLLQGFERRKSQLDSFVRPDGGFAAGMRLREPDGLQQFAGIRLVQKVTHRDGIAVDRERLEPDGSHDRVVHDQEVGVKLMPSSATIFGRPGAGARESEPTTGQRMEIHA